METPVTMPQFAETLSEGTVGRWLKQPGERVEKYESLVEVLTDKVNVEMPAPVTGQLVRIVAKEGDTVPVGGLLAYIVEEAAVPAGEVASVEGQRPEAPERAPAGPSGSGGFIQDGKRITPVVARLAAQYGVDLSQIPGTGLGGRVTKQDLLNYMEHRRQPAAAQETLAREPVYPVEGPAEAPQPAAAPTNGSAPAAEAPATVEEIRTPALSGQVEKVPVTPMRRIIAEHMVRSKFTAPHAWTMLEVDVTSLVRLRESTKEDFRRREGVDLTYVPFVVKAVAEALRQYPVLNAAWAGDMILLKHRINIGIAVAREDGLIVPVVKDADRLNIVGLAHAINDLVARARSNTLTTADVVDGTFTVNNTGTLGSVLSYPIVYPGQAGIMTMEAIVKRPVVLEDAIAIRSMMNVALAFDHRILDGSVAGGFLRSVKARLEAMDPEASIY